MIKYVLGDARSVDAVAACRGAPTVCGITLVTVDFAIA